MNRSELGAALRALRDASGKEAKAVARGAVMSVSKLSKIETGKLSPHADDVEPGAGGGGVSARDAQRRGVEGGVCSPMPLPPSGRSTVSRS
ncbi:helix-turn-helix domain-containing protein [Streptomyces sp. NPDC054863]